MSHSSTNCTVLLFSNLLLHNENLDPEPQTLGCKAPNARAEEHSIYLIVRRDSNRDNCSSCLLLQDTATAWITLKLIVLKNSRQNRGRNECDSATIFTSEVGKVSERDTESSSKSSLLIKGRGF